MEKITGNEPAMPNGAYGQQTGTGLTIRQELAARAMQGLASKGVPANWMNAEVNKAWVEWVAQMSCEMADELILELNKEK